MDGLIVDLPYPSLDGLCFDPKSVRIISPAYADRGSELTAILQYVFQAMVFAGRGCDEYDRTLTRIAIAEMHHLDLLGEMMYRMGALPVFTSDPPRRFDFYSTRAVSYAQTTEKMLQDDIQGEMKAIRDYERMVERLDNEQVSAVISRIILDEKLHLETLRALLEKREDCR